MKFDQIQIRESEVKELGLLMANVPCEVHVCQLSLYLFVLPNFLGRRGYKQRESEYLTSSVYIRTSHR